ARDHRLSFGALEELAHVPESGARHRVAAIQHGVDGDAGNAFPGAEIDEREEMLVERVDAALADQPNEMHRPARPLRLLTCVHERAIPKEAAIGDGAIDPYEILHHDAAGAEIQVANFAVADLMLRQSNRQTRSREQRLRIPRGERVPRRRLRQGDCISLTFCAVSSTFEYD